MAQQTALSYSHNGANQLTAATQDAVVGLRLTGLAYMQGMTMLGALT